MYILNWLDGREINRYFLINLFTTFTIGIILSHFYREVIVSLNWLRLRIIQLIPRMLFASIVCSAIYFVLYTVFFEILVMEIPFNWAWLDILQAILNLAVIFMVWSLLYFLFHFIQNYRKEEIKNLRFQTAQIEMELNKLKSQLNPHFIFNSMNSIRALVEENPAQAKQSITQLSNILRNTLLMGRKRLISFKEELQLVEDYLSLEKTRFEERLHCQIDVSENCKSHPLPPMILQTLVENAIKHGISKLPEGGDIILNASKSNGTLQVEIINDGNLDLQEEADMGFGLSNTRQRLQLLYGEEGKFNIYNLDNNKVKATMSIPESTMPLNLNEDESLNY